MIERNIKHQVCSLQTQRLRHLSKTLALNVPFDRETTFWTTAKYFLRNLCKKGRYLQCKKLCFSGAWSQATVPKNAKCERVANVCEMTPFGGIRQGWRDMTTSNRKVISTQTSMCHLNSRNCKKSAMIVSV